MGILEETLGFLGNRPEFSEREIRSVHLNNYSTVVELDDGSVGACMSSYELSLDEIKARQTALRPIINCDALLLEYTKPDNSNDNIARAIRVATISALSARLLRRHDDAVFETRAEFPHHFFEEIESAVIIGFGGLLNYVARRTSARKIHVSDLLYRSRRTEIENRLAQYRRLRPDVDFSVSDGSDSNDHLSKADFVSITGSTLTNGTLEQLLMSVRGCRKVVLQGQSASIYPKAIFEAGVDLIATTLKPRQLAAAAFWDPTGEGLRPFLEGGLPWLYVWPKTEGKQNASTTKASLCGTQGLVLSQSTVAQKPI